MHLREEGFELGPKSSKETVSESDGGAESGALNAPGASIDPALRVIEEAWPGLHESIKAGILALVKAANLSD